jgi:acetyl/propionyl-CoA carboxylase alpha subunit
MPGSLKKILIANRGEIALRIIRACKELGLSTVGIYSDTDKNSSWINQCNEGWPLKGNSLAETYLDIQKIISIALQSGADAIHPGYGFLSENYHFAEVCQQNNLVFIGPSPEVLMIAGNKTESQIIAMQSGIPVPGKRTGSLNELLAMSAEIQYPVLVKAVAGGGGKGIRLINSAEQLPEALQITSREAFQYFGDGGIYLEEYLHKCRHIEVQIIGDLHGNLVHLFERECSVQRRHQKVIEEAPAESLSDDLRLALYDAALKIAKKLDYTNAGTIEFLVDNHNKFYFLEINPRIQVEHGITEMITGIDIVKEQIMIAAGNSLSFDIHNIKPSGFAIEARISAEDPENGLLPSPGRIHYFSIPREKEVRVDTAADNGAILGQGYDPLIAKVMVHEPARADAIRKLESVIQRSVITGIRHNLSVLKAIVKDKDYLHNNISTRFLEEKMPLFSAEITKSKIITGTVIPCISAALILFRQKPENGDVSPWKSGYWRNVKQIRFRMGTDVIEMDFDRTENDQVCFYVNDMIYTVSEIFIDEFQIHFSANGEGKRFYYMPETDNQFEISDGQLEYCIERYTGREHIDYAGEPEMIAGFNHTILAPQPGTIMDIKVTVGQEVKRGDNLLVIESMKLENTILAGSEGLVKRIAIKRGDKVKKNEPLIYLQ